ncbi:MAG: NUDIX domain-containing protein [Actinomycetes bacterium]
MTVPVRDAATVVVLRDGPDGPEVWLQQRSTSLVFAAGMHAFPGGAVDPDDAAADLAGADVASHARVWGDDVVRSASFLAAAVRETFEECGVRLHPPDLKPWARWITPPGPPRRFDARFFVTRLPDGQVARPLTGEVALAHWVVVRSAVDRHASGDLPMWPPTITTLTELVPFDDVAAVLRAAPPTVTAVTE